MTRLEFPHRPVQKNGPTPLIRANNGNRQVLRFKPVLIGSFTPDRICCNFLPPDFLVLSGAVQLKGNGCRRAIIDTQLKPAIRDHGNTTRPRITTVLKRRYLNPDSTLLELTLGQHLRTADSRHVPTQYRGCNENINGRKPMLHKRRIFSHAFLNRRPKIRLDRDAKAPDIPPPAAGKGKYMRSLTVDGHR